MSGVPDRALDNLRHLLYSYNSNIIPQKTTDRSKNVIVRYFI